MGFELGSPPATFIVRAEVFPMSRKTARLSANAQMQLSPNVKKSGLPKRPPRGPARAEYR